MILPYICMYIYIWIDRVKKYLRPETRKILCLVFKQVEMLDIAVCTILCSQIQLKVSLV